MLIWQPSAVVLAFFTPGERLQRASMQIAVGDAKTVDTVDVTNCQKLTIQCPVAGV